MNPIEDAYNELAEKVKINENRKKLGFPPEYRIEALRKWQAELANAAKEVFSNAL